MKKVLIFAFIAAAFASCSDNDGVTYDSSQAYVAFSQPVYNLGIPLDSETTINAELLASNKVDHDRTYQLSILDSETDANAATYQIPATVTIPANSYVGVVAIKGIDGGLVDSQVKKLTLKVAGYAENESTDLDKLVINIYEFCPVVISELVGDYSSTTWFNDFGVNVVSEGAAANTLVIEGFYAGTNPNFVITYDPENNNNITFETRFTGASTAQGEVWARMSTVNTSSIDACTGKIGVWVNYYIPNVGGWGDQYEVFSKL